LQLIQSRPRLIEHHHLQLIGPFDRAGVGLKLIGHQPDQSGFAAAGLGGAKVEARALDEGVNDMSMGSPKGGGSGSAEGHGHKASKAAVGFIEDF